MVVLRRFSYSNPLENASFLPDLFLSGERQNVFTALSTEEIDAN
jgi:hypothetical protein